MSIKFLRIALIGCISCLVLKLHAQWDVGSAQPPVEGETTIRKQGTGYGYSAGGSNGSYYSGRRISSYSGSGYTYYEDVPDLNVTYEAGKNYDSLVAKVMRIMQSKGVMVSRQNDEFSSYSSGEKRRNIIATVSKSAFPQIQTQLQALDYKYEFRSNVQQLSFSDTNRLREELIFYRKEKEALSKVLDTLNAATQSYRAISQNILDLMGIISSKENDLKNSVRRIQYPCNVHILIYTSYSRYHNKQNAGESYGYESSRNRSRNTMSWKRNFIPGIQFMGMTTSPKDSTINYSGIGPEFSLFSRFRSYTSEANPSYTNVYAKLGILHNDNKNISKIYYTGLGARLSFENRLKRKYLIPWFGDEICYFYKDGTGSSIANMASAGAYLYINKQIQSYLSFGYVYPFQKRETYSGYTFSGGLSFLLWN